MVIIYKNTLGPIFTNILNRMKSVAQNAQDSREKFYAFSAHDTSVAAILAAFGIQLKSFPKYGTIVFIELHRDFNLNNKYYVKVSFFYYLEKNHNLYSFAYYTNRTKRNYN